MNVTNLESVTFGIADFAACRRFWTDFGLTESAGDDGAIVFSCKNGSSVSTTEITTHPARSTLSGWWEI